MIQRGADNARMVQYPIQFILQDGGRLRFIRFFADTSSYYLTLVQIGRKYVFRLNMIKLTGNINDESYDRHILGKKQKFLKHIHIRYIIRYVFGDY